MQKRVKKLVGHTCGEKNRIDIILTVTAPPWCQLCSDALTQKKNYSNSFILLINSLNYHMVHIFQWLDTLMKETCSFIYLSTDIIARKINGTFKTVLPGEVDVFINTKID